MKTILVRCPMRALVLGLVLSCMVLVCLAAQNGFTTEQEFFGESSPAKSPSASPAPATKSPAPAAKASAQPSPAAPSPSPATANPPARRVDASGNAGDFLNDRAEWDMALDTAANVTYLSTLEKDIVFELNMVRSNPAAYATIAEAYLGYYQGSLIKLPGRIAIRTNEGQAAVQELIRYLRSAKALPPLTPSAGLSHAARDHAADQGKSGATGHSGGDGSTMSQRINRYGSWSKTAGENIDYGWEQARLIVLSLLVDDGVSSRGHRSNIMNKDFLRIGVACGPHKVYGQLCVMDFAGGYSD